MTHKTIILILSILLDIEGFRFTSRGFLKKLIGNNSLPWAVAKSLR
jgi:hypothetical protein